MNVNDTMHLECTAEMLTQGENSIMRFTAGNVSIAVTAPSKLSDEDRAVLDYMVMEFFEGVFTPGMDAIARGLIEKAAS